MEGPDNEHFLQSAHRSVFFPLYLPEHSRHNGWTVRNVTPTTSLTLNAAVHNLTLCIK
jgi:hypothetical protein